LEIQSNNNQRYYLLPKGRALQRPPHLGGYGAKVNKIMETENKDANKSGRGGRRVGAGRKPKGEAKRVTLGFVVSETASNNLKAYAERMGKTRNDVINDLLEGLV
jgi:hypothetical protein